MLIKHYKPEINRMPTAFENVFSQKGFRDGSTRICVYNIALHSNRWIHIIHTVIVSACTKYTSVTLVYQACTSTAMDWVVLLNITYNTSLIHEITT